jgi:hypothetical protein
MMKQLKKAEARSFRAELHYDDGSYKRTWTAGSQSAVFGLWSNSHSEEDISKKFASGKVTIDTRFKNLLPFKATLGDWYSSAALGIAYSEHGTPPWVSTAFKNWNNTFSSQGDMQRFTTVLLIANAMTLTYTTEATFSSSEQTEIKSHSSAGLWPFYNQSSDSESTTDVHFNSDGSLSVTPTTKPGVASVVGAIVEPVADYLGFTAEASRIQMKRLFGK